MTTLFKILIALSFIYCAYNGGILSGTTEDSKESKKYMIKAYIGLAVMLISIVLLKYFG